MMKLQINFLLNLSLDDWGASVIMNSELYSLRQGLVVAEVEALDVNLMN
jgi:hypothetical protein